jgi:hypothetical protein
VHCTPQAPQLLLAVSKFAQVPLQFVDPDGQAHWPSLQIRLPEHTAPQSPQLFLLVFRSTQEFPHWLSPEVQVMTHVPSAQRGALAGQRCPHEPQLALSALRLMQLLPQTV